MWTYLIHFDKAYKHARHYVGSCENIKERLLRHKQGRGARLIEVIHDHDITWQLARLWRHKDRSPEQRLKKISNSKQYCPICTPINYSNIKGLDEHPIMENDMPGTTVRNKEGTVSKLANFEAEILQELIYVDGDNKSRVYIIHSDLEDTADARIDAADFAGMTWVAKHWGANAIISPTANATAMLRAEIQNRSNPKKTTIWTHTGWTKINKQHAYLTRNVAIFASGRKTGINVMLPADLSRYQFPTTENDTNAAVRRSLALKDLGPPDVTWPLLAATYRAPLGDSDFAIHITGKTGTFKSEAAAIFQSHYGATEGRQLPCSWSSTPNAIEALCYRAKDALIVIDDFIPIGSSYHQRQYQKSADQVIRAQGNQAGRARLTDTSMHQQTMYPRGLIISTGEDTPEGHSCRARLVIAEVAPGDITTEKLSEAQVNRTAYAEAMAAYIQWLAKDIINYRKEHRLIATNIRNENLSIGHTRTPETMGQMLAAVQLFLTFAYQTKAVKDPNKINHQAKIAITKICSNQVQHLASADPADMFLVTLRSMLAGSVCHVKGMQGGIPRNATALGWSTLGDPPYQDWKPHGIRVGWADDHKSILYLDAALAYDAIKKYSRGNITLQRQTLYKRLREAGILASRDENRQRNTIRVTLEHATRQVLAISLDLIMGGDEL